MKSVFISGSISLSSLPNDVKESLRKIEAQNLQVLIGDAKGVDNLIQKELKEDNYTNVIVNTIYETPRNIVSNHFKIHRVDYDKSLKSEREKQTQKDKFMTMRSDYSLIIWDGKSIGSYSNIKRAFDNNKKTKVFYTVQNRFLAKDELTSDFIDTLHKNNTGYTLSELVEQLKIKSLMLSINSATELKKWLIEQQIIRQKEKIEINEKYSNYFVIENYRGNQTIKYKLDLLNLLQSNSLFGRA